MLGYKITFGMRYSRELHPTFPPAHPDGHVLIIASSEAEARAIATSIFDNRYAFIYSPQEADYSYSPLRLATFAADDEELLRVIGAAVTGPEHPETEAVALTHIAAWLGDQVQRCRVCGCVEWRACMTTAGPCFWVEQNLCSACIGKG